MIKQVLIISGKGGTGKTVVTGSFAAIAKNKVMVDCDVDAADLHLLLQPTLKERHEFKSGQTAFLNSELCKQCGLCLNVCRFEAIKTNFVIESFSCEGCRLCSNICPFSAIEMKENIAGEWFVSDTKYGAFIHAKLGIAEENSGKLVAKIRQIAKDLAEKILESRASEDEDKACWTEEDLSPYALSLKLGLPPGPEWLALVNHILPYLKAGSRTFRVFIVSAGEGKKAVAVIRERKDGAEHEILDWQED